MERSLCEVLLQFFNAALHKKPLHLLLLVEWLSFVPVYPYAQKPIDAVVIFPIFSLVNLFGFGKKLTDNLENMKQEKCWTNNKWKQIHIHNQSVLMQFIYLQYNLKKSISYKKKLPGCILNIRS